MPEHQGFAGRDRTLLAAQEKIPNPNDHHTKGGGLAVHVAIATVIAGALIASRR